MQKNFGNFIKIKFDKKTVLSIIILIILLTIGSYLRLRNLGALSFWGDDGTTYMGVEGVLKHGYPLLPSKNILYHGILNYYISAPFALISGLNEISLRLPNVISSLVIVIFIYLFAKKIANRFVGYIASIISTFSIWSIEFSREARYYSTLQLFFLLSIYFFYLGFVENIKKFKILSTIFIILTGLVHGNGYFLILLFIPLLLYKKKKFFKSDIIISLVIIIIITVVQVINQVFFWEAGRSFYSTDGSFLNTVKSYLQFPSIYYYKILEIMYPKMYYVHIIGLMLLAGLIIYYSIKKGDNIDKLHLEDKFLNLERIRIPFGLFILFFMFYSNIIIISFGNMNNQPRYIFYLYPLFILIYSYTLYSISILFYKLIIFLIPKYKNLKLKNIIKYTSVSLIILAFFSLSVEKINILEGYSIGDRKHGGDLNSLFAISTTVRTHHDSRRSALYVKNKMGKDDLIITTDLYNSYPYTNKTDYWLWSGNLASWSPYKSKNGVYYDDYLGSIVIRDIHQLFDVLNENINKNIWIITSRSFYIKEHVNGQISNFIISLTQNEVFTGEDGVSKVYLLPKDEGGNRFFNITNTIEPKDDEILKFPEKQDILLIDFSDPNNSRFLRYGWSKTESIGTWSNSKESSLFISFYDKKDYEIKISLKPLLAPTAYQNFKIYINENLIGEKELNKSDFSILSFKISKEYIKINSLNRVSLHFKYTTKPCEVYENNPDSRNLTTLFEYIEITES